MGKFAAVNVNRNLPNLDSWLTLTGWYFNIADMKTSKYGHYYFLRTFKWGVTWSGFMFMNFDTSQQTPIFTTGVKLPYAPKTTTFKHMNTPRRKCSSCNLKKSYFVKWCLQKFPGFSTHCRYQILYGSIPTL